MTVVELDEDREDDPHSTELDDSIIDIDEDSIIEAPPSSVSREIVILDIFPSNSLDPPDTEDISEMIVSEDEDSTIAPSDTMVSEMTVVSDEDTPLTVLDSIVIVSLDEEPPHVSDVDVVSTTVVEEAIVSAWSSSAFMLVTPVDIDSIVSDMV